MDYIKWKNGEIVAYEGNTHLGQVYDDDESEEWTD